MLESLTQLGVGLRSVGTYLVAAKKFVVGAIRVQEKTRAKLVRDLSGICGRVDTAIDALDDALRELLRDLKSPVKRARAAEGFDANGTIRALFKPEHLCSEVDTLLADTGSLLSTLRWSWGVSEFDELRRDLTQIQSLDGSLKDQYDNAVTTIRQYGAIMSGSAPGDPAEALSGLRAFTATLTAKLRDEGRQVREVKNSIVRGRATPK